MGIYKVVFISNFKLLLHFVIGVCKKNSVDLKEYFRSDYVPNFNDMWLNEIFKIRFLSEMLEVKILRCKYEMVELNSDIVFFRFILHAWVVSSRFVKTRCNMWKYSNIYFYHCKELFHCWIVYRPDFMWPVM